MFGVIGQSHLIIRASSSSWVGQLSGCRLPPRLTKRCISAYHFTHRKIIFKADAGDHHALTLDLGVSTKAPAVHFHFDVDLWKLAAANTFVLDSVFRSARVATAVSVRTLCLNLGQPLRMTLDLKPATPTDGEGKFATSASAYDERTGTQRLPRSVSPEEKAPLKKKKNKKKKNKKSPWRKLSQQAKWIEEALAATTFWSGFVEDQKWDASLEEVSYRARAHPAAACATSQVCETVWSSRDLQRGQV
ncbi:unnamed protein product [Schistocephalus solidus]|uniref:FHA domain-containing protein n=1 Tax=Schistocephalus solidus TaxID=70667 RepID=A0A183SLL8_SCHSO|nr:unnamed protein product [Schistocephalus solidus]